MIGNLRPVGVGNLKLDEMERNHSHISWREPLLVTWIGGETKFACRVCIANNGLKLISSHQWPTEAEAKMHIIHEHLAELQ